MKDIPVIEPKSDIRKDVRVIMPTLDLFGETK